MKQTLLPPIVSITLGIAIGCIKFLFEDVIGFSLIVIFPMIYGVAVGYALAHVFRFVRLEEEELAECFAALSITVAIVTFFHLERAYLEGIVPERLAAEGRDVSGLSLPWVDYFGLLGELGTEIRLLQIWWEAGMEIKGAWFYALMIFEFILMYWFAVQKVREFFALIVKAYD
jgi:uncharacterized membrane protein